MSFIGLTRVPSSVPNVARRVKTVLARFGEGPYDGVSLHVKENVDHIILPIMVHTSLKMCERTVSGQALYRLVSANDYECRYQFEAIRM
jgi:hypothetical protein